MTLSYNIKLLSIKEFLNYQISIFGIKHLLSTKYTKYPRIFARGYCDHARKEIVICLPLADLKLFYHEIGHELGLRHSEKVESVMYPNFKRGNDGIRNLREMYSDIYGLRSSKKIINAECSIISEGYK